MVYRKKAKVQLLQKTSVSLSEIISDVGPIRMVFLRYNVYTNGGGGHYWTRRSWNDTANLKEIDPMLVHCWSTVCDAGPRVNQHWTNVSMRPQIIFIQVHKWKDVGLSCVWRAQRCRAKTKGSICLLYKWADTAFWLCRARRCNNHFNPLSFVMINHSLISQSTINIFMWCGILTCQQKINRKTTSRHNSPPLDMKERIQDDDIFYSILCEYFIVLGGFTEWRKTGKPKAKQYSEDRRRWINVGLTLVQRRRRWTNVKPTLIQRLVSAGI